MIILQKNNENIYNYEFTLYNTFLKITTKYEYKITERKYEKLYIPELYNPKRIGNYIKEFDVNVQYSFGDTSMAGKIAGKLHIKINDIALRYDVLLGNH